MENLLHYKQTEESRPVAGVGLFPISSDELERFISGESLKLQSIYEKFGMTIIDEDRYYGDSSERNFEQSIGDR